MSDPLPPLPPCACGFAPPASARDAGASPAPAPAADLLAYARGRLAYYCDPAGPTPGVADTLRRARVGPVVVVCGDALGDYLGPWGPPGNWQGTVAPGAGGAWAIHLLAGVFTTRESVRVMVEHELHHLLSYVWQRVHGGPWALLSGRPDWQALYAAHRNESTPSAEEALALWGGAKLGGLERTLWPDVADWLSRLYTGRGWG